MSGDAADLHDLEQCARRVYQLHDDLAEIRTRRTIDLIFDRDRRVVIGLTGQLLASVALIPWFGAGAVLAGLAVLYVGAFSSAAWTISRMRRARARERKASIEQSVRQALATCPPLDSGARAVLTRMANLVAIPPTPRSVAMLRAVLGEAEAHPDLRAWPFLDDVISLVEGQNGRVLATPPAF